MSIVKKFNGLNGAVVSRKRIENCIAQANEQEQFEVVARLKKVLEQYPENNSFDFVIDTPATECLPVSLLPCIQEDEINEEHGLNGVSQQDIYDSVTEMMINTIEKVGHLPWQKEWQVNGNDVARNYVSKKAYTGINFLMLNFEQIKDENGKDYIAPIEFIQPYYLTFKQIEAAGAKLKKGSKSSKVFYYTLIFNYKKDSLEIKTSDKVKFSEFVTENNISKEDLKENAYKIPVIKYYNVFRADDCTGLKFPKLPERPKVEPIETAQDIIDHYPNPPKYTFGGDRAVYYPGLDKVNMPVIEDFDRPASYYSTYFHECIHSTGHEKRLKRFDDTYAFEELIAELGAVYLCSEAGILFSTRENSAKYLKFWNGKLVKAMKNDNRFFLKAAAAAQKGANHILDLDANDVPAYLSYQLKNQVKPKKEEPKEKRTEKEVPARITRKRKAKETGQLTLGLNGKKPKAKAKVQSSLKSPEPVAEAEPVPSNENPVPAENKNVRPGSLAERLQQRKNEVHEYYTIENPEIAKYLGNIEKKKRESVVITLAGEQGSMKTRMAFQLMEAFAVNYRVGHASIEEHPDSSLYADKAMQYLSDDALINIEAPEIRTVNDLQSLIVRNEVIVIDSFAKMQEICKGFEVDKDLRKIYDGKLFIVIFQQTVDGKMRGGSKSQYDADIVLLTEKFSDYRENYSYPNKNRYNSISPDELKFNIHSGKLLEPVQEQTEPGEPEPIDEPILNFEVI